MLESMVHQAEPTRAEASDVANAVLDGTSALMLSQETAIGEYPVAAVAYMDRIARAVEPSLDYRHQLPEASEEPTIGRAMSNAACDLAEALGAPAWPPSPSSGSPTTGGCTRTSTGGTRSRSGARRCTGSRRKSDGSSGSSPPPPARPRSSSRRGSSRS